MKIIKVLLLEDDENDMDIIKIKLASSLSYNFDFKWVISKKDFTIALKEFNPDIVLSDYNLPQLNGLEAIKITLEHDSFLPIVIVTGALTDETAVDCIKAGAWDYIVKERLHRLPIAFENALKLKTEKLKSRQFEAELKLIRSKTDLQLKLLYDAIDKASSSVIITDANRIVLYVNPKFEQVTGYKKEEVIGKNPRIIQSGYQDKIFYDEMWAKLDSGEEWKGQIVNRKKSGEVYWEDVSISPIFDNGIITNFVSIQTDVTELIKAKEKAEESNIAKSTFLTTMSHELRTPLNSILGFSTLIQETNSLEKAIQMAKIINENGEILLKQVQSIFDISMFHSKQKKVNKKELPLANIFDKINYYFMNELSNENIVLSFLPEKNTSKILINTDEVLVNKLISNLIDNAFKFTNEGSIEYGYTIKKDNILFFVKDTGIGIPKDKLTSIFEIFNQVNTNQSAINKYSGIGLGLSICKEISNLLGGSLWVESEVDKGATFYFLLPNVVMEKKTTNKSQEKTNINLEQKTILVAEDVESNYLLISEMLKKTKAKVLWAKDGQEAINIVKEEPNIDIILMDIRMPNINGYIATTEIKKLKPEIYIIVQTAYDLESEMQKAFQSGCNDYISKPIRQEVLYEALKKYKTL